MRIAYVCSDFGVPVYGHKGASIHLRAMARAFADLGHEVRVLSPAVEPTGHPEFDLAVENPVDLEPFAAALGALRRIDKTLGVLPSGHAARTSQEARTLLHNERLPSVAPRLAAWQPDLVYERYALFGSGGLALARALGVPHLLEVNAPLVAEQERARGLHLGDVAREIERRVWSGTDAFLAVSEELRGPATAAEVATERLHILPNGVDAERFTPQPGARAALRRGLDLGAGPVVGFVGSLKPWHGTDVLLDAFARLAPHFPAARLLVVGEGPARDALLAQAAALGIAAQVRFTGAVEHGRVPDLLAAMDVAAAPYLPADDFYFSPIKIYEYLAAGVPVVASAIGQIQSLVDAGWVTPAPAGDAQGLASALAAVLADPGAAAARTARGRDWTLRERTWTANARRVVDLAAACTTART